MEMIQLLVSKFSVSKASDMLEFRWYFDGSSRSKQVSDDSNSSKSSADVQCLCDKSWAVPIRIWLTRNHARTFRFGQSRRLFQMLNGSGLIKLDATGISTNHSESQTGKSTCI